MNNVEINEENITITEMQLAPEPYAQISSGEKTVEVRLYDDRRRILRVGDIIRFRKVGSENESVTARIIGLHRFDSFVDLFSSPLLPYTGFGGMTASAAAKSMYKYYTPENENRYGVLGIELCLLYE